MKTQDKMKTGLVNGVRLLFGAAHLTTAIAGELIATTEALVLRKQFEYADAETGEIKIPTVNQFVNKRKHISQQHVEELREILKDPSTKLAAYKAKIKLA